MSPCGRYVAFMSGLTQLPTAAASSVGTAGQSRLGDTAGVGDLPTGTVTFLFTDVEDSTRLWDAHRATMSVALARHDAIMRTAIAGADGHVFATGGDGFCAVFTRAANAVVAAVSAQREMAAEPWPEDVQLRVRMGVHTGEVQERDGDYFGPAVNRAARLMSAAHGGQVVVSALTADLLDVDAIDVELVDLGSVGLKGVVDPVQVFGVSAPGVPWIDRALVSVPVSAGIVDVETGSARSRVIRTPDQRLRVFVSSTLGELAPERAAVRSAVERLRLIPVMFELGARPHPPAQLYRAYLEQSQVFVGVYWERYGWVAPDETISGLEDEFILSEGMPRLMYIKEPATEREDRLEEMIDRLADNPDASYRRFTTPEELAELLEGDLAILLSERFEAGQPASVDPAVTRPRNKPPVFPAPLTPTIGREGEVESVAALIRSGVRLVTITGVGGVGKTRLASEVSRALQGDFDDVRFVRLGDLVDPRLVTATIAAAMGVPVERTQPAFDAVASAIGDDRVFLALDNLEQLVGVGPELAALLDRCARLHLLLTSRQVMRLRGEREYPLAPLGDEPAVALFVEHAQAARSTFRLDSDNAAAVAELCRRLDGLPLAVELVASRIRLLSPEDLLTRLGDRLLLVTGGSADLPDRQRTLQATLDWSHRLLDRREQALFALLGVFRGGASIDAIEAVCGTEAVGDVLETLASLLEKSLVTTVDDTGGGPRFGMLGTVRAYAWEQLEATGDLDGSRDRHAAWYQALARSCDPARRPGATAGWAALEADLPNLRAAVAWLTEQDDTAGLAVIASSLWTWYWITGKVSEARIWIEALWRRIDLSIGELDAVVAARVCTAVAAVRFSLGDYDSAAELFRRALVGFDAADDAAGSAEVSCMIAVIGVVQGAGSEPIELAAHSVATSRRLELDWSLAHALAVLGGLTRQSGSAEQGRVLQLESLEIMRRVGERVSEGQILSQIAVAELTEGNFSEAGSFLVEAVGCCRETRHLEGMAFCLEIGAVLAFGDGRVRHAAVLVGAADAIRESLDIAVSPVMRAGRDGLVVALVESLGADENALALAEGRSADPFALLGAGDGWAQVTR